MVQNNMNTPMMRQYHKAKKKAPGCLLLFRLGDFFEFFFDDAREAYRILGITLTNRKGVPMCGFPFRVAERHIKTLLDGGKKIAICDQVKPNLKASSNTVILEREIIEIITPGTISNNLYLSEKDNNYTLAIFSDKKKLYAAWLDVSVGALFFQVKECSVHSLLFLAGKVNPKEILINSRDEQSPWYQQFLKEHTSVLTTECDEWTFSLTEGKRMLLEGTKTSSLRGFGINSENEFLLCPAAALLHYIQINIPSLASHIKSLHIYSDEQNLEMDSNAIYNLELFSTIRERLIPKRYL